MAELEATIEPGISISLGYKSSTRKPMARVGAQYSFDHDLTGLHDRHNDKVHHAGGNYFAKDKGKDKVAKPAK